MTLDRLKKGRMAEITGYTLGNAAGAIFDPLGFSGAVEDVTEGEEKEANEATINGLKRHFTKGFHTHPKTTLNNGNNTPCTLELSLNQTKGKTKMKAKTITTMLAAMFGLATSINAIIYAHQGGLSEARHFLPSDSPLILRRD